MSLFLEIHAAGFGRRLIAVAVRFLAMAGLEVRVLARWWSFAPVSHSPSGAPNCAISWRCSPRTRPMWSRRTASSRSFGGVPVPNQPEGRAKTRLRVAPAAGPPHIVSLAGGYALRDVSVDSAMFDTVFDRRDRRSPGVSEGLTDASRCGAANRMPTFDLDGLEPVWGATQRSCARCHRAAERGTCVNGRGDALIADLERRPSSIPYMKGRGVSSCARSTPPAARATPCGPSNDYARSSQRELGSSLPASCANSSRDLRPGSRTRCCADEHGGGRSRWRGTAV